MYRNKFYFTKLLFLNIAKKGQDLVMKIPDQAERSHGNRIGIN